MWQDDLITAGAPAAVGVVGILGTFFAPAWVQRAVARRTERRAFRQAKRLVVDELDTTEVHLRLMIENGRTPQTFLGEEFMPTAMWKAYRAVLAEMLPDDEWEPIATVMGTVDHHRMFLAAKGPGAPLDAEDLKNIAEAARLIHENREHLESATPINE